MVATGVALETTHHEELRAPGIVRLMVLGIIGYDPAEATIEVGRVTAVSVAVLAMIGAFAVAAQPRPTRAPLFALLVVLVAVGYARTRPVVERGLNAWAVADAVEDVRGSVLPPGPVRYRVVPDDSRPSATTAEQRQRAIVYQFYLPENTLYFEGSGDLRQWTPYVFAPVNDDRLVAADARIVWRDPAVAIGLWIESHPGPTTVGAVAAGDIRVTAVGTGMR
jgi:hypothetical protein